MSAASAGNSSTPRTSYEQYVENPEEWPYEVVPVDPSDDPDAVMWIGDKEYAFVGEDGGVYQGRYCRAMIDNAGLTEQPLWLGFDRFGSDIPLIHRELFRGIFVGGKPGEGKTTAASNIMLQLAANYGFVFLDPGGEEYYKFLQRLPEEDKDRVVTINPQADDWREQSIGFNYLETFTEPGEPGHKEEVASKVADLMPMIEADDYPLMQGVAENMIQALIKANATDDEYDYCLIDLYHALSDTDKYVDIVEEARLTFLQPYAERLRDEIDSETLEPLLRRVKRWIENDLIRPLVATRDSDLSMEQVVDEDLIVLVNCDIGDDRARKMFMRALRSLTWTVISSRPSTIEREMMEIEGVTPPSLGDDEEDTRDGDLFKPFFFIADEFHVFTTEDSTLPEILAMARKKRFGVIPITQNLEQLTKEERKAILGLVAAFLSYNPGRDQDETRVLSNAFGEGISKSKLSNLDRFHAVNQVVDSKGRLDDPAVGRMLPEYPIRRTREEASEWINYSRAKWGSRSSSEVDEFFAGRFGDNAAVDNILDNTIGGTGVDGEEPDDADLTDERLAALLSTAFSLEVEQGDEEGYVGVDEYTGELIDSDRDCLDISESALGVIATKAIDKGYLDVTPDAMRIRLTGDGRMELFGAGASASGGGITHRSPAGYLSEQAAEVGYRPEAEMQGQGQAADLLLRLPSEVSGAVRTKADLDEKHETLREEYPEIWELSGDEEVAVELEKATQSAPSQTFTNHLKAREPPEDEPRRHVLFVVWPGDDDKLHNARRLHTKISSGYTWHENGTPSDVVARYHQADDKVTPTHDEGGVGDDQRQVFVPGDVSVEWVDEGDGAVTCRTKDGTVIARFASEHEWRSRTAESFASPARVLTKGEGADKDVSALTCPTVPEWEADDLAEALDPEGYTIAVLPEESGVPLLIYDPEREESVPLPGLADRGVESSGERPKSDSDDDERARGRGPDRTDAGEAGGESGGDEVQFDDDELWS